MDYMINGALIEVEDEKEKQEKLTKLVEQLKASQARLEK